MSFADFRFVAAMRKKYPFTDCLIEESRLNETFSYLKARGAERSTSPESLEIKVEHTINTRARVNNILGGLTGKRTKAIKSIGCTRLNSLHKLLSRLYALSHSREQHHQSGLLDLCRFNAQSTKYAMNGIKMSLNILT